MKFEIRRSSSATQPYYWRIVAANGQILATSETYVNKSEAISAATSVKPAPGPAHESPEFCRSLSCETEWRFIRRLTLDGCQISIVRPRPGFRPPATNVQISL